MQNQDKKFCIMPFLSVNNRPNGSVSPCCHYRTYEDDNYANKYKIKNLHENTFSEIFNGDLFAHIRSDMLEGINHRNCDTCYEQEAVGVKSLRQWKNEYYLSTLDHDGINNIIDNPEVRHVEYCPVNKCNLACATCNPINSSVWERELNVDVSDIVSYNDNPALIEDFASLSRSLQRIEMAGGEPLVHQLHDKLLKTLAPEGDHIFLKYNTNGTILKESHLELWKQFKHVQFDISIDATGERFEYLRYPGKFSVWDKNVKRLDHLEDRMEHNINKLYFLITVSCLNITSIPETLKYIRSCTPRYYIHANANFVFQPNYFAPHNLPQKQKDMIKQYIYDNYGDDEFVMNHVVMREALSCMDKNPDTYNTNEGIIPQVTLEDIQREILAIDKRRGLDYRLIFPEMSAILFSDE